MIRLILFIVAMTLAISGTLVFMAGQTQMDMIPGNYARLIGTGCFMFSGVVWCMYGFSYRWVNKDGTSKQK